MPKIITVGTLKGGTGKTTFTFNLAGILAENKRVLICDADPQCNLTTDAGIDSAIQTRPSTLDLFEHDIDPEDVIIKEPVKGLPGLDLIPSHIKLTATEMQLANRAGREQILANWMEDNADALKKYDYVIFDTNPSMNLVNKNAFYVADKIILVSDVSFNGAQGVELFMYLWKDARKDLRKEDNVAALVINNYDKRTKVAAEMKEYVEGRVMDLLVDQPIPATVKMKDTSFEHKPINVLYPDSAVCEAMRTVVKELKEKGVL